MNETDRADDVREQFERASSFERLDDDAWTIRDATFEATVRVEERDDGSRCVVVVEAPTLDAAVVGERVAGVVEEGWYETFVRRVEAVDGVTRTERVETPAVRRDDDEVVVTATFTPSEDAPGDARALVTFVEGTWVQGIVPGYEYVDRIQAIREQAHRQGGDGGSTPL